MNRVSEATRPDVSVVLAVKNESRYIREAIGSILGQEGVDLEVIVIDDGSTDDTRTIVQAMAGDDPRLQLRGSPGTGKVAAFNHGVAIARGLRICLFAGDDIMPEGSLLARWLVARDLSEAEPGAALFKIQTLSEMPRFDGHVVPRRKGRGNPSGQSPLMNTAMVALLFPVPDDLPNEDTWIELAVEFLPELRLIHSDVICCLWRVHDGNSYNMTLGFDAFHDRLGRRQRAVDLFYARFEDRLTARGRARLRARMRCNEAYRRGSVVGVLASGAGLMTTLRALSSAHPGTYWLRRRFFGLLSGW